MPPSTIRAAPFPPGCSPSPVISRSMPCGSSGGPDRSDDLIDLGLVSNEASPEGAALSADSAHGLRLALVGLRSEQRRALVLAYFYGMTAAEISEKESIPLGTAKTRIRAGLRGRPEP